MHIALIFWSVGKTMDHCFAGLPRNLFITGLRNVKMFGMVFRLPGNGNQFHDDGQMNYLSGKRIPVKRRQMGKRFRNKDCIRAEKKMSLRKVFTAEQGIFYFKQNLQLHKTWQSAN